MNSDNVVNKILSDAQEESAKISAQSQAKIEAEEAKLKEKLDEYNSRSVELAKNAEEEKKKNILANARMTASKNILRTKRELLNGVFEKAKETILGLNNDEYLGLMKKLIMKSVQTGDEEILLAEGEKRINGEFIKQINRELGNGYKGNLRLTDVKVKSVGGFVLKRGSIFTNVTIEILVEQAKSSLETEIAKELFNN